MLTPDEIHRGVGDYYVIYEVESGAICAKGRYSTYANQRTRAEDEAAFANGEYAPGDGGTTGLIQEWLNKPDNIKRDVLHLSYPEGISKEEYAFFYEANFVEDGIQLLFKEPPPYKCPVCDEEDEFYETECPCCGETLYIHASSYYSWGIDINKVCSAADTADCDD